MGGAVLFGAGNGWRWRSRGGWLGPRRLRRCGDADVIVALALLVHVSVDDLRGKLRGVVAPVSVLPQDRDDDVRIAPRGHADEPGVGYGAVALVGAGERVVTDHLGGSGLAREVDPIEMRGVGGADGAAGHIGHGIGDDLPVLRGERDGLVA